MNITQQIQTSTKKCTINALRLIQLSVGGSMSKVMMASDSSETIKADAVINVFRTFGQLNKCSVRTFLSVSTFEDYAENIITSAQDLNANLILFPVEIGSTTFPKGNFANIAAELCEKSTCSVAIFVERGFGVSSATAEEHQMPGQNQRILFPFIGGADDCEAALFLTNIAAHKGISITVLRFKDSNATPDQLEADEQVLAKLGAFVDVKIEKYVGTESEIAATISKAKEYSKKDLIVVGYKAHAVEELGNFLDSQCISSFVIIKKKTAAHVSNSST